MSTFVILEDSRATFYFEMYPTQDVFAVFISFSSVSASLVQFARGMFVSVDEVKYLHSTLSLCGPWAGSELNAAGFNCNAEQEGDV